MNVTDQWMLERMQQMAANMLTSLPQTGQNSQTPKTEKEDSFQDLLDKAKDPETPDSTVKKTETVQKKEPVRKSEGKVVTDMKDPRIRAMDPVTQAQIAAGFITPVETDSGALLLRTDAEPSAVIMPLLPDGTRDPSQPITLVNSDGETFEVYLDQENGDHKLFQVMPDGGKQQISLFPEQPKAAVADSLKELAPFVEDRQVADLRGSVTKLESDSPAEEDVAVSLKAEDVSEDTGAEEDSFEDLDAEVMTTAQPLFKDAEAAPVKVGENFTLDTQKPDMEDQLAETIRLAAQEGLKQVEIKLSPENLGALTIRLTQSSDGTLQVVLHAANNKAASLLTQHLDNLNLALQGYSQNEVRVQVQRGEDSQQAQQHQTDPNGHNRQQQQQQQRQERQEHSQGDFIQRLRLGLFETDV